MPANETNQAFAFFEFDVVATVATSTILINPFIISSLQNLAEFVAGVPIYGHQLFGLLPEIAEEIRKQQPFFAELDMKMRKIKMEDAFTMEWYSREKQKYVDKYGEYVKLNKMPYFEMVNPVDSDDERNSLPDDEDRIIKF